MKAKKWLHIVAFILVIVGAINSFLIAFVPADANRVAFDLIAKTFEFSPFLRDVVYSLIFASAIYLLATHAGDCKVCETKKVAAKVE